MIALACPWALLLLPLPLAVTAWWPARHGPRPALQIPFLDRLVAAGAGQPGQGDGVLRGGGARRFVLPFIWLCGVAAIARPQWIEPPVSKELPMRDLLLAVDLSGSMETRDFLDADGQEVDRLTAVKQVLDSFLTQRKGDRVGLIFFGTAPFVQAPFTDDLEVTRQLLAGAQVKMAGPQTAFGDAIGLAIHLFERSEMKQRVLIVLTDGNDTSSQVPPEKAAQIARDRGIVIHTVSVGDPQAAGEQALDVPTLQAVAAGTGGIYSAASDRGQLAQIYARLGAIEPAQTQTVSHRPKRDIHWIPLAAGLVVSMLYQLILIAGRALPRSIAIPAAGKEVRA